MTVQVLHKPSCSTKVKRDFANNLKLIKRCMLWILKYICFSDTLNVEQDMVYSLQFTKLLNYLPVQCLVQ